MSAKTKDSRNERLNALYRATIGRSQSGFHRNKSVTPRLTDILQKPELVREVPRETIPVLLAQLAAAQSLLTAQLIAAPGNEGQAEPAGDRLLGVEEAARKLSTTKDWLYRHAGQLPFTVRPSPRQVRFSERGIERYIRHRAQR